MTDYASIKTGPLTAEIVRDVGWREMPLRAGKPTRLYVPVK